MKILVAVDGSGCSRKAIEKGFDFLSTGVNSEVKIIGVVDPIPPVASEGYIIFYDYYQKLEDGLRAQMKEVTAEAEKKIGEKLAGKDVFVTSEVLTGNPKKTIVDEAENWGADLIVTGSHGYGFLDRSLLGSVSDFIVHHAPCSVLIVR